MELNAHMFKISKKRGFLSIVCHPQRKRMENKKPIP